jgi:L-alanine-DL-glutamate epimerase-like enolase superfamily enzyme
VKNVKITQLEIHILRAPDKGRPHCVINFIVHRANELLVRIRTDQGVEGFSLATNYTPMDAVVKAFHTGISDLIISQDPFAPERLYQQLFALTSQRLASEKDWSREVLVRISSAVELAARDIVGKVAGLPFYRLLGGYRNQVPCYVTCAYYRDGKDMAELRDEIQKLKEQGHRCFNRKVGGLPLAQDIERMALIREIIGDDRDMMIDVNRACDLVTAIEAAKLLEPLYPRWLEEPVRWVDDRRELKLLAMRTHIPLSAGESELTSFGCRYMLEEQAIRILQFDCTMMGGFTEGRKLAGLCEPIHTEIAPHHACLIHEQLVATSPAG